MARRLLPRATLSTEYGSACCAGCRPAAASTVAPRLQRPLRCGCQPRRAAAAGSKAGLGIGGEGRSQAPSLYAAVVQNRLCCLMRLGSWLLCVCLKLSNWCRLPARRRVSASRAAKAVQCRSPPPGCRRCASQSSSAACCWGVTGRSFSWMLRCTSQVVAAMTWAAAGCRARGEGEHDQGSTWRRRRRRYGGCAPASPPGGL